MPRRDEPTPGSTTATCTAVGRCGTAWASTAAELDHPVLRLVQVLHREVQVCLLGMRRIGPLRRCMLGRLLEAEARAGPGDQGDPFRLVVLDFPTGQFTVEMRQFARVRAIQY